MLDAVLLQCPILLLVPLLMLNSHGSRIGLFDATCQNGSDHYQVTTRGNNGGPLRSSAASPKFTSHSCIVLPLAAIRQRVSTAELTVVISGADCTRVGCIVRTCGLPSNSFVNLGTI